MVALATTSALKAGKAANPGRAPGARRHDVAARQPDQALPYEHDVASGKPAPRGVGRGQREPSGGREGHGIRGDDRHHGTGDVQVQPGGVGPQHGGPHQRTAHEVGAEGANTGIEFGHDQIACRSASGSPGDRRPRSLRSCWRSGEGGLAPTIASTGAPDAKDISS